MMERKRKRKKKSRDRIEERDYHESIYLSARDKKKKKVRGKECVLGKSCSVLFCSVPDSKACTCFRVMM